MQGCWAQEFIIYVYTGPKAQFQDVTLFEKEQMWLGQSMLVEKEVSFDHNGPGGWAEDECLLGQRKPRLVEVVCRPGEYHRKFYWHR